MRVPSAWPSVPSRGISGTSGRRSGTRRSGGVVVELWGVLGEKYGCEKGE